MLFTQILPKPYYPCYHRHHRRSRMTRQKETRIRNLFCQQEDLPQEVFLRRIARNLKIGPTAEQREELDEMVEDA